jgi:hypothetical protein
VQNNKYQIPGMITMDDKLYEVCCDYSSVTGDGATADAKLTLHGPEATNINPLGKIDIATPVMMRMLSADGPGPVLKAQIGDMIDLDWQMMNIEDDMDFFVRECIAEEGGDLTPPKTKTLKLIERGCPTPAVYGKLMPEPVRTLGKRHKAAKLQAFRFDGSRTIRVVCQIDVCPAQCEPVICDNPNAARKKRDIEDENVVYDRFTDKFETSRYTVPKRFRAISSLMIIDPVQEARINNNFQKAQQRIGIERDQQRAETVLMDDDFGKICLPKSTFLGVFVFLGFLTLAQAAVVGFYVTRRLTKSS